MRADADGKHSYALCNASRETSLEPRAGWKCQRYFIERSNQEAQSELGGDELQAQKYRAWEAPCGVDGVGFLVRSANQVRVGAGI